MLFSCARRASQNQSQRWRSSGPAERGGSRLGRRICFRRYLCRRGVVIVRRPPCIGSPLKNQSSLQHSSAGLLRRSWPRCDMIFTVVGLLEVCRAEKRRRRVPGGESDPLLDSVMSSLLVALDFGPAAASVSVTRGECRRRDHCKEGRMPHGRTSRPASKSKRTAACSGRGRRV